MANPSKTMTKFLVSKGYPPFNVFDTNDYGKPFKPSVYKNGNIYHTTLKPDTDLELFQRDTGITIAGTVVCEFNDTAFQAGDKHDRGNSDLFVYWKV